MNTQSQFCAKCGKPLNEGQLFCPNCGANVGAQTQNGYYQGYQQQGAPAYTAAPVAQPKRKTYTAQKFISMGFAIGDLVFAFSFWLCGLIFGEAAYMYDYDFYDYYSTADMMSETFEIMAGAMYFLAVVLLIGSIVAWVMFGVYSKKRKEVMAQIELEKQQAQANTWNQI